MPSNCVVDPRGKNASSRLAEYVFYLAYRGYTVLFCYFLIEDLTVYRKTPIYLDYHIYLSLKTCLKYWQGVLQSTLVNKSDR